MPSLLSCCTFELQLHLRGARFQLTVHLHLPLLARSSLLSRFPPMSTPRPSQLIVAPDVEARPLHFTNRAGERCIGTLDTRKETAGQEAAAPSRPRRCVLLCHGMLSHRSQYFFPPLSSAMLHSCSASVDAVYRFDWSGMGESEGMFQYGGYSKMVDEMDSAVAMLQQQERVQVTTIVAHSMGAQTVMLYASKFANVPHIVTIGQ